MGLETALAVGSLAVGVAGAVTTAVGTANAADAQRQAADYQAQVSRNNAIIANQNASAATQAGETTAMTTSLRSRALLGAITANEAASGVDVNSGSALDTRQTQREIGQLDTETQINNAALRAYGYRSQSTGFEAEAGLDKAKADQAGSAGIIGATSGLLGSASSLGLKWQQLQNSGVIGGGGSGLPAGTNVNSFASPSP